jgi:glutamate-ammonia-ligase adenylyltransferase
VSLDSFARYQREQAWTWEHMALCRARPLFGPAPAQAELRTIIADVLGAPRDPEKLKADVLEMRARMAEHKPGQGALDAKLKRGGLVDLEFLVHFRQLASGLGLEPNLGAAIDQLAAAGLLPADLRRAHDRLTRLLVAARLLAPDSEEPPSGPRAALAAACGYANWDSVTAGFAAGRQIVANAWREVFGEELELD